MKKSLFSFVLILVLAASLSATASIAGAQKPLLPEGAQALSSATLVWQPPEGRVSERLGDPFTKTITDARLLAALYHMLEEAQLMEAGSNCPFYGAAMMKVVLKDGRELEMELAWDDCTVLRLGEDYYNYMPPIHRDPAKDRPTNSLLFDLFLTGTIEEGPKESLKNSLGLDFQKGFGEFIQDRVNVRKKPGGDILFRKAQGEELFILARKEQGGKTWYQVETYNAQRTHPFTGWVQSDLVKGPGQLFSDIVQIAAYDRNLIALRRDGSVVFAGSQFKYPHMREGDQPDTWQEVVQVAAGELTGYGLKADGSLYRFGIRGPVSGFRGVLDADGQTVPFVKIAAKDSLLVGQMADGSLRNFWKHGGIDELLPPGSRMDHFSAWYPYYGTALVVQDGRVKALDGPSGQGVFSREDKERLAAWQDVAQVEAGFLSPGASALQEAKAIVAALKTDGSVIALDPALHEEVASWAGITKIVSGNGFLLGLTGEGRVLAAGPNKGLVVEDIKDWSGITDIAAGRTFCAGLTRVGSLLFAGEAQFQPW